MQYYLGLSVLSTMERPISRAGESAEARRVLSLLDGRSLAENDIDRDAQGRPFFPGREAVNFNITHSGALTAVSYAKGGNLRTGCDVEQIRRRARIREIAEEFFSVAETNYIFSHGGFDESRFYEIWTLKECFIKLRGLSVFDMAACPSFINAQDTFIFGAAVSSPLLFYLYELSGGEQRYILSAALEGTEQQPPEIRWFSQSSLTCKMIAEIKAAPSPDETVSPKM